MRDLNYQLKILCRHSHEGSFETRVGRERQLTAIANQLHELGFRQLQATSLKQKHIKALVDYWQRQNLSPGTIKNRMSCLRWWAEKVNRRAVVATANDFYGIPDRQFVSDSSKAKGLAREQLDRVKDEHVRMSLRLQKAFGLRREEALKIRPRWADRGDHLHLKASWTKGGRERTVPIRTREQRALLEQAKRLAGLGALIPGGRSYIEQLRIYERHTANAGLSKMHGLRHAYAQQRYLELTGWPSPHGGGPSKKDLTPVQQQADQRARLAISKELGHVREQITAVYLGR
ncbi:integrase [Seongchinamella unica]|uniref:Integrase n=1 Tax=Seongchinamella unica TaxID=2547392 RepID=A0A4R5LPI3_9GAMM|nr:phage integrase N-terminal domain-containing protein [Seongchinamella unica]TDG12437.1 integrase [Seongchinamella unica]